MTAQQFASYVRQGVAYLAVVFGVLTAAVSAIHLPVGVSSVMSAAGLGLLAVEHYVADPSTGTTPPNSTPPS